MPRPPGPLLSRLVVSSLVCFAVGGAARAQEAAAPPAYLAMVEGTATLERDGDVQPAVRNMPFVPGDRLRTEAGRVEIDFPDGTTIEVDSYSEVEAVSPTRVRVLAGSIDHVTRRAETPASAAYLPQDLQRYGSTLDQNGSWQIAAPYGYVWYPTVAPSWRPYYYGSWSAVPSYGWTWVGLDAWSWPTHHYGRWGHARNAWFWIPGRNWSNAWVSWGIATDYVGWCPLGFDGRPVFALSAGGPQPWAGWTMMARSDFGSRAAYAHNYSVDSRYFDARTPFIETSRAPVAVPRVRARVDSRESGVDRRDSRRVESRDPRRVERGESVDRREPSAGNRDRGTARDAVVPPAAPAGFAVPRGSVPQPRPTTNDYRPPTNDYQPPTNDYRPPPGGYQPPIAGSRPVERLAPASAASRERAVPPQRTAPPGAVPPGFVPQERAVPRTAPPGAVPPGAVPSERPAPPQRAAPAGAAPPGAVPQERAVPRAGAQPSGKGESAAAKRPR